MSRTPFNSMAGFARREDQRLLTAQGRYVHDLSRPGMLFAAFARSAYAHGRIVTMDLDAARAAPGVVAVFDGTALGALRMPASNPAWPLPEATQVPVMPRDAVRAVGQALAVVVARDAASAQAAAALVWAECESDPADAEATLPPAPVFRHGAPIPPSTTPAVEVVATHHQPRVVALAMEPRAIVAEGDADGALCVWLGTQSPSRARADIAQALGMASKDVRVVVPDVGGAFGAKSSISPEELVVAWLARELRACVKWTASRSEEFTAGCHGRGASLSGRLRLGDDGSFRHLEARLRFPLGQWQPYSAVVPARNAARILPGPYRVPSVDIESTSAYEHAAPVNIYRGAGRPEATLLTERLVERAARRIGIDPVELRRRNLIPAASMPYRTPTGETFDAGDYGAALDRACELFDYAGECTRRDERRRRGEVVGIGVGLYVEPCGQGWESARVTLRADGIVTVASGSCPQGQGHETSYAAIAASALGIDPAAVSVQQGDTASCPEGVGALASRSMAIGGSAVLLAARRAARRRDAGEPLPLTEEERYTAPAEAWSYGCVIAGLRIDRDTGKPHIERIVWADDAGHIVSPTLAHGQLLGGLAQGVGQAMLERIVYDDDGQLMTGSLMDYAVPRADDIPPVAIASLHRPTDANALGAKGVGEAGCIGVPAALLNAAADALSPFGEPDLDFPLTPERLWQAMRRRA